MRPHFLLVALSVFACQKPRPHLDDAPAPIVASPVSPALPGSPPDAGTTEAESQPPKPQMLWADAPMVPLPVEGFADAVVSVPSGAFSPRPIVIATHGNYDRPEWQCEVWREIVETRAFVLCPRGEARGDSPSKDDIRFTYPSNQALEREIDAGLRALRARFGSFVAEGPIVYTGFSLGAIMGVSIAARSPDRFARLVLIEGGHDKWTLDTVKTFAKGGGQRVLFVCSQSSCGVEAKHVADRLVAGGVQAKLVRGPPLGHRYDGPIAETTKASLDWVLEGDARFAPAQAPSPSVDHTK